MSIQPLPAHVIDQIKSSIAITNLNSVVCELIKNSLDAGAARVDITVDHGKGGCIVEDNGSGILPFEFEEKGGLGKLYHSSKLHTTSPSHGCRGTFLAALSAMSVLTVVSHHLSHRSHNMITMHKSEVVSRQIPAPPQQHLTTFTHGTRVVVRDLFGNMPVRVKQRALAAENQRTSTKEWDELRHDLVALLLAWPGNVAVTARDTESNQKLNIRPSTKFSASALEGDVQTSWVCSILSQASFISPEEEVSWVSVGASTPKLKISGTISLDPCATKHAQFISYGIQPLKHVEGQTILHDEINRLFSNSAFRNDEEIEDLAEAERWRRANDLRFKGDGFTNKELKGPRKGVDRWPMFYIDIQQTGSRKSLSALDLDEVLDDRSGDLGTIMDLLQAMVLEFLTRNRFRPRKTGRGQRSKQTKSTSPLRRARPLDNSFTQTTYSSVTKSSKEFRRAKSSFDQFGTNVKLPSFRTSVSRPETPFETWSRSKSGLPISSLKTCGSEIQRPATAPLTGSSRTPVTGKSSIYSPPTHAMPFTFKTRDVLRRPFEDVNVPRRKSRVAAPGPSSRRPDQIAVTAAADDEELMSWTNPVTRAMSLVNRRTGLTIPAHKLNSSVSLTMSLSSREKLENYSIKTEPNPWIRDLLSTWDNPIFAPAEPSIPRIRSEGSDTTAQYLLHGRQHHCTQVDIDRAFTDTSSGLSGRISRNSLRDARVISQVDKKFILVKLKTFSGGQEDQILVLIDQHAADERIRIESLMEELCTQPSNEPSSVPTESGVLTSALCNPLNFEVVLRDIQLLQKHRSHFANWGIIYQVPQHDLATRVDSKCKPAQRLAVTSLPPGILERCKLDPRLLIDLIRTEVYKISAQATITRSLPFHKASWLERIHGCPQGLIDMLNSRACRSAIMFNDELSTAQCEVLVRKLSRCMFPFQCAHGRPSLVPLVDVGQLRGMGGLLTAEDGGDFGREMRKWKERMG